MAQVKSITFGSAKVKDGKDGQSYGLDFDLRLFGGVGFLGSMALGESMPYMLGDHGLWVVDDGNHVMVSNHYKKS